MTPLQLRHFTNRLEIQTNNCWKLLDIPINNAGYAILQGTTAHRVAFEWFHGYLPSKESGLVIDHLCHNRWCVNPDHLEAVPQSENIRRGAKCNFEYRADVTCKKGHPLNSPECYKVFSNGQKYCKQCYDTKYKNLLKNGLNLKKKFCKYGHPRIPGNLSLGGNCKTCASEQQRERNLRKKAAS